MARFIPPDHSKGDPNTIGGYRAVHDRPAAFEGSDGASYSVEIVTDESGDNAKPFAAYLLFVRWGRGDPVASGHLETEFISFAGTEEEASRLLGEMKLSDAKTKLDGLIRGDKASQTTWWDAMHREGSSLTRTEGVVLNGAGGVWNVRASSGETHEASLRGRLKKESDESKKLAVGDRVVLEPDSRGTHWAIEEILPRHSQLARRAPGGGQGERIVAANVDQVVVVFAATKPEPHRRMLDRFLVIAEANSLDARIVINKIELVDRARTESTFADYVRAGYPVHFTSVKQRIGLEELHRELEGRTSALSGPSGVGKSSLMNAMYPGLDLRVGEVSESVNKGRHTTVGALLHPLPDSGYVVDTPGLREIGTWGLSSTELDSCFREFREFIPSCRFGNCTHRVEPGCAVRAAVDSGAISGERYDSYLRLREEIEIDEKRAVRAKRR